MLILVLNSGSSSIKFQLHQFRDPNAHGESEVLAVGQVEKAAGGKSGKGTSSDHLPALDQVNQRILTVLAGQKIDAIGHRVVHGGERFIEPAVLIEEAIGELEQLSYLAPLHNPDDISGIRAAGNTWPGVPQVAVFDTAFHMTLPESAWRYAIPEDLYSRYGIRRYGFHGTSVEYVTKAAAGFLGLPLGQFDGIIAHLGSGASVTAIQGGRSIDTSMGFTPVDGLVMGTRCGDIDPSIVLLLQRRGLDADAIEELLNLQSGFQALCGFSDMRSIEEAAMAGHGKARLALEIAAYRLAKYIGGYHVAVGGAKALVFTAGIGENSSRFRSLVVGKLGPLGVALEDAANLGASMERRRISSMDSAFPVLVIPTDEARAIAEATAALIQTL
ncbi:acetate/propionate family kinase [Paeniglutamicibacter kerguelensis]|uniref:Acetate kinase n=1 Tax=Paeniglutamicibacter kerguelensis TaxID=254788 RepID=A0ABS4XCR6_9MICC|nr:acetate/propionate family kinase [Paeniglutamicibacter kerguelensis]MBP2386272.1 acetate kinase [Paeniglutamicibacter kerguelensis]